jgi:putative tricarboxylic transport membrane protein
MVKNNLVRGMLILSTVAFLLAAVGCGAKETAKEASWPQKEIEIVYQSKAGSSGDIYLRTLGKAVEPKLGKAWVVNNVVGAAGANAWNYVAKAKADGYTLLGVSSTLVVSPLVNKLPINYTKFEPVANMFIDPAVIFVKADSPYKTLKDLIDDAKKNPGKQKWSGGTPGDISSNVAAKLLMEVAGFEVGIVPFEGGSDGATAVLGGHLTAGVGEYAEMKGSVDAGQLRILATFNKIPYAPEIQSVAEAGYPSVVVEKFRGVMAPKGTPPEVIDKLSGILKTAYDDPEFKKYMQANYLVPAWKDKAEFAKLLETQTAQVKASLEKLKN